MSFYVIELLESVFYIVLRVSLLTLAPHKNDPKESSFNFDLNLGIDND